MLLLCALRAAVRLRRVELPAQVARQHPAVKQGEHTRQKQQDEQNGRERADGDRAADLLDGEVAEKAPAVTSTRIEPEVSTVWMLPR